MATVLIGAALPWGYSYLFPNQAAGLSLRRLTDPQPVQAPQTATPQPQPATSTPAAPSTSLVAEKDSISGFQVSHPQKWMVQSQDSFVLLRSDECGLTTVIFYPMQILGSPQKPTELLPTLAGAFIDQVKDGTQALTLGSAGAEGDSGATALLSGTMCGSEVTGSAQLTVQGNRALLKLAWYPVALKDQFTNTLTQILQSYRSVTSTAIFGYQGTVFQLPVPEGYLFEETDRSGSVHSGDRLLQLSTIDFAADQSLDAALDSWLQQEKDAGRELSNLKVQSSAEQSGDDSALNRYNTITRLLTYTKDGVSFQGALTAAYTDALGNTALIVWRTAPASQWTLAESTLLIIEQGVRYQAVAGTPGLELPVYATWRDVSPLTGTSIRTSLASTGSKIWQSLILNPMTLTDATGAQYIAPLNALNPETGTYTTVKDGKPISLQPIKVTE